jgi:hypothetical protein
VSKSSESSSRHAVRAGRDAISAVKISQALTAAVDAWAEAHQIVRSDAIRQLIELGLKAAPIAGPPDRHPDSPMVQELAVKLIDALLDPSIPPDERERRIRRLTEGPPEFLDQRIDLPKHET